AALDEADNGLTSRELEQQVNLSATQIEKVLKSLAVKSPAPLTREDGRWYATAVRYVPDTEKIEQLTRIRYQEQARMWEYMRNEECLMLFLERELDDPAPSACGRCAVCQGRPLLPEGYAPELAAQAIGFLRGLDITIDPRKRWPRDALIVDGWRGAIAATLQAEPGRALCSWGDDGWGQMVRRGKQDIGRFDDALVAAVVTLVRGHWRPEPFPTWVTCVPSLTHPDLVPDFARRVAATLSLRFVPCVRKVRRTAPQKDMQNSYQQAHNLASAFQVESGRVPTGSVLLLDDMVDSRWTFTVVAALLRQAGSGRVFPLALSSSAGSE
ncbi:MAG: phosphoribosyltransferase, partial [Chloroflexota bacterium]|nr:phosphoribosyltransferase [Chloroflexota bacterium]